MDVSNRSLALGAVAAFVLAACAVLMTVVAAPVDMELPATPTDRVAVVPEVLRDGGAEIDASGPLAVQVERGTDTQSVLLTCGQYKAERPVEAGLVVFPSLPIGDCELRIAGTDASYGPVFPGDRVRCGAQGRITTCTGGLAHSQAGSLTVTSVAAATVSLDGAELGEAPVEAIEARVGGRRVRLDYPDGRYAEWSLVVAPDQEITVHFPRPPAGETPAEPTTEPVVDSSASAGPAATASAP